MNTARKNINPMKRIMTILLAVLLFAMPLIGYAENAGYPIEENTGRDKDSYPWIIRTPYAIWHLSKADMELLGEDAYCERLFSILDDTEADFADARAALKGYIPEDIPPIDIYTDFCNKAEASKIADAFYRDQGNYIKLFRGWETVRITLLHEYIHYLTIHCAETPAQFHFWQEGFADYISIYVCKNRLSRSVNMGYDLSVINPAMLEQAWDQEDDCLDPRLVYLGFAALAVRGYGIGEKYFAIINDWIVRTEQIQENPMPDELYFYEAAGMVAYLVETYGRDTVFGNWDLDPDRMETVYGKTFPELYHDWTIWNDEQCAKSGIVIP